MVCTVASLDTQCIDSNLESVRYVSRVGRARGFSLSLGTIIGTYGTLYLRYAVTKQYKRVPRTRNQYDERAGAGVLVDNWTRAARIAF